MLIPKIGVTGHRPSGFSNQEYVKNLIPQIVDWCSENHPNAEFNLGGCVGADMWVAQACVEKKLPFNLHLPFPVEIQSKFWSLPADRDMLASHALLAHTVSIVGDSYKVQNYHIRDRQIVDNSDFIICFWEGRRSGGTYNTIRYALKSGKRVLNAMSKLEEVNL